MARIPRFRRLLPLAIAPLLVLGAVPAAHHTPPAAHAQLMASVSYTPMYGDAQTQRLVAFSGFDADEVLTFSYTDPNGNAVTVAGQDSSIASAMDDGTGAFFFRPSDWLDSLQDGLWTVTITGEHSGSVTATFYIGGN